MAKERSAATQAHSTILHWAAANGNVEHLLLNTAALRMMHMLQSAGPRPFEPFVIDKGPCMKDVQRNVFDGFLRDHDPLEFTITFRGTEYKIRTYVEAAERLMPRYEDAWLLCGTLAAHHEKKPHERPSLKNALFFAKGYIGKVRAGGVVYFTPYMARHLNEERTLI